MRRTKRADLRAGAARFTIPRSKSRGLDEPRPHHRRDLRVALHTGLAARRQRQQPHRRLHDAGQRAHRGQVQRRQVTLAGEAKQRFTVTASGDPLARLPEDRAPTRGGFTITDDSAQTVYPWQVAAGFAQRLSETFLIALSGNLQLPQSYARIGLGEAEAAETGLLSNVHQELTWNASIGMEWLFSPNWPIRAGVFTNRSSAPEIQQLATHPSAPKIDLYGATVSVGWKTPTRSVNIGVEAQLGSGHEAVRDRLAGPDAGYVKVAREQYRVLVFLSGATQLAKRKATNYGKDKADKLKKKVID